MKILPTPLLFSALTVLIGCSSFGKGVTEAILEQQQKVDTRICEIKGKAFEGLKPHLDVNDDNRDVKVLMVHGVGNHQPGYASEFLDKLVHELDLNVTTQSSKNIQITDPHSINKKLGNLRISRFLSHDLKQELLFYELTWSEITADDKKVLDYDNSGEFSFKRAEVNDLLKKFTNDTGPDPIIYLGQKRDDILRAFAQSFCWMINGDWASLPDDAEQECKLLNIESLHQDNFAFVSHSLGSRIVIDGLQRIATVLAQDSTNPKQIRLVEALKQKTIPIYMMSNQLPMLQLGRKVPEIHNQRQAYCSPDGENYQFRMLKQTSIIAFSDPNDLLSYTIPVEFVQRYLDSRLCIDVTNIQINVAPIYDVFGLGSLANPVEAHIGYDSDDRVVGLIAKGISDEKDNIAKAVAERCRWIKTIE